MKPALIGACAFGDDALDVGVAGGAQAVIFRRHVLVRRAQCFHIIDRCIDRFTLSQIQSCSSKK